MKRPILVVLLGYILGIIVGLYFNISIVFIYILAIFIYKINKKTKKNKKFKILSLKRYFRYLKIYLKSTTIIIIVISSLISNSIVLIQNNKYNTIYNIFTENEKIETIGVIKSNKEEKEYYNKYKIEIPYKKRKIKFYITVNKTIKLKYGDKVKISGDYIKPEGRRNYKGYDYKEYLKQYKIYGTIKCNSIEIIQNNSGSKLFRMSNFISNKIIENTKKVMNEDKAAILIGLILGNKDEINEETQENFKNASMSHILAISGMHITYIILGIEIILKNIIGKRKTRICCIFVLIIYSFITNFTPSVTRASIMGILMIYSKIIYRKNDIFTTLSLALLISLIYNPFMIKNLGLQLSYGGTIGIVCFNKSLLDILNNIKIKNKTYRYVIKNKIEKFTEKIKEIISISMSVNLMIFPIIVLNLNTFNIYFLITNILLSIIIAPIIILGFIFINISLVNIKLSKLLVFPIEISINILELISNIGKLPGAKIYIPTINIIFVIIHYFIIILIFKIYKIYSAKKLNKTQIRIRNLIALLKINLRKNKYIIKKASIIIILLIISLFYIPQNLKVNFIDVEQGDSCLIITPYKKTILIDGGGSSNSSFDVGKNTLLPYILDRKITKIDFIIISHFDNDHVQRIIICYARNQSKKYNYRKTI